MMRAPYTDVAMSFSGSRLAGTRTTARGPSSAARAATGVRKGSPSTSTRSVVRPRSTAFAAATATTRSLNECVGLAVSSFRKSSPMPSASARRGADTSGVKPGASPLLGRGLNRQEAGIPPDVQRSGRDGLAADRPALLVAVVDRVEGGRSKRAQTPMGSSGYCVSQTRHLRAVAGTTTNSFRLSLDILRTESLRSAGLAPRTPVHCLRRMQVAEAS